MTGEFADPFSRTLDENWRARLDGKKLYANDLFLTLVRRPLQGRVGFLEEMLSGLRGVSDRQEAAAELVREQTALNAARDGLISALSSYGARLLTAYHGSQGHCSEPLEFLSLLYNGEMRPVRLPDADLGAYLPYRRVSFGADTLELGANRTTGANLRCDGVCEGLSGPNSTRHVGRSVALANGNGGDPKLRLCGPPTNVESHESRAAPNASGGR